jgi:drug/metabolite transporter (DMT)-like permease
MKPIIWVGILLVVLGVMALAYQGINYNHQETVMNVGPMHVTADTHDRMPLSPILGGLALAGGVLLLAVGAKQKA